jgi:hypothetical protein
LSQSTHVAGAPSSLASAPLDASNTITPTMVKPTIQPSRNAGPLTRARGVPSMSTTAMIGTGLNATPTANDSTCPIACPIAATMARGGVSRHHPTRVMSDHPCRT